MRIYKILSNLFLLSLSLLVVNGQTVSASIVEVYTSVYGQVGLSDLGAPPVIQNAGTLAEVTVTDTSTFGGTGVVYAAGLSLLNVNGTSGTSIHVASEQTLTPFIGSVNSTASTVILFTPDHNGTFYAIGGKTANPFGSKLGFNAEVKNTGSETWNIISAPNAGANVDGISVNPPFGAGEWSADAWFNFEADREYRVTLSTFIDFFGATDLAALDGFWQWALDEIPGATPNNPLMPITTTGSTFNIPVISNPTFTGPTFVDPVVATGYSYSSSILNFGSFVVPNALPNGDANFELHVLGQDFSITAGTPFDFTALDPGGVNFFSITGIDPNEGLDPNDPNAFVSGLTFVGAGASMIDMTPITEPTVVPEPASIILMSAGFLTLLGGLRARRSKR